VCVVGRTSDAEAERWNLYYRATPIGQYHGTFRSPYSGPNRLLGHPERDVSLNFLRPSAGPEYPALFRPEIAGGRGFSGVTGIANFPNGEMPRGQGATPTPYLARLYVTHDFGFGSGSEAVENDVNPLGGERPATRYRVTAGRFAITDFSDNNRYTHDPRTPFTGWGIMYNGAWDYAADSRGYTWGWVHEFHARSWSVRCGSAAEPKVANGMGFDRLFRDRADMFEGEIDYKPLGRAGVLRVLSFLNRSDGGTYATAIELADRSGATHGFDIQLEQVLTMNVGVFM
jgi:high affinity Mn2+ porin